MILRHGVFYLRTCKLCAADKGIVVGGEYGLTTSLFSEGYTVDTLMAMYRGVDWHDKANWNCNANVHPSRHGTYDGISMSPYETVFLKSSWHVGIPFADKYAVWLSRQLLGQATTHGSFNNEMYRYAVQCAAHPLRLEYHRYRSKCSCSIPERALRYGLG